MGSQQTLRAQLEELEAANNQLSKRLREEQLAAHQAYAALKKGADQERQRLRWELEAALGEAREEARAEAWSTVCPVDTRTDWRSWRTPC